MGPAGGAPPPRPPSGMGNNPPNPPGGDRNPGGGGGSGPAMPHNCRQPRRGRQAQPQPTAPNPLQGADPTMVAILDRLITAEQRKQEDAEEFHKVSQRFTMFPTTKFDGLEPSKAYDH